MSIPRFAADNGIAFRSIYNLIDRTVKMSSLPVMRKIETGTDGEVTVAQQIAWFEREPDERNAKSRP